MSEVSYAFPAAQNPKASALPEGTLLPPDYAGEGTDEHLLGLYTDLAARGVDLSQFPTLAALPRPMLSVEANFYAQRHRIAALLERSAQSEAAARIRQEGAWWDFEAYLPLAEQEDAGNYLLRLMLHFDAQFDSMVTALQTIITISRDLPKLETLDRFDRLMSESIQEDGYRMKVERAWEVSQAWEYAEVRKLLASDMDVTYGLHLASLGADSFEEAKALAKRMPKHWVESLME